MDYRAVYSRTSLSARTTRGRVVSTMRGGLLVGFVVVFVFVVGLFGFVVVVDA